MPSTTKSQQRLMGMAYAYKTGKLEFKNIDPKYRESIIELTKRISKKDLEDYAKKKIDNAPEKVAETTDPEIIGQNIIEPEDLTDDDINYLEEGLKLTSKEMYKHFGFNGPKFGSLNIPFFADFDVEKNGIKTMDKGTLMDYRDWISK